MPVEVLGVAAPRSSWPRRAARGPGCRGARACGSRTRPRRARHSRPRGACRAARARRGSGFEPLRQRKRSSVPSGRFGPAPCGSAPPARRRRRRGRGSAAPAAGSGCPCSRRCPSPRRKSTGSPFAPAYASTVRSGGYARLQRAWRDRHPLPPSLVPLALPQPVLVGQLGRVGGRPADQHRGVVGVALRSAGLAVEAARVDVHVARAVDVLMIRAEAVTGANAAPVRQLEVERRVEGGRRSSGTTVVLRATRAAGHVSVPSRQMSGARSRQVELQGSWRGQAPGRRGRRRVLRCTDMAALPGRSRDVPPGACRAVVYVGPQRTPHLGRHRPISFGLPEPAEPRPRRAAAGWMTTPDAASCTCTSLQGDGNQVHGFALRRDAACPLTPSYRRSPPCGGGGLAPTRLGLLAG